MTRGFEWLNEKMRGYLHLHDHEVWITNAPAEDRNAEFLHVPGRVEREATASQIADEYNARKDSPYEHVRTMPTVDTNGIPLSHYAAVIGRRRAPSVPQTRNRPAKK